LELLAADVVQRPRFYTARLISSRGGRYQGKIMPKGGLNP